MRIIWSIIVGIPLIYSSAFGTPITPQLAKDAAGLQLNGLTQTKHLYEARVLKSPDQGSTTHSISETRSLLNEQGEVLAYVLVLDPTGYIVVSPDTDIRPVIAYSLDADFPFVDTPDNTLLHFLLLDMENRLNALGLFTEEHKENNRLLWEQYLAEEQGLLYEMSDAQQWGPYITTQWHQADPYNKFCPLDPETENRSVVGCTATAVAQIINYWEYPSSVSFGEDDSYETSTRSINIDEDYDLYDFPSFDALNQMLAEINYDNEDDIAALNFAVGISLNMDYTSSGSGTWIETNALTDKFGYSNASHIQSSPILFYNVLKNDMKQGRPAKLSISEVGNTSGHAIVADGYKDTGEYHVNFGWGGAYNEWYFLPEGMPEGYDTVDSGVLGIYPYASSNILYVDTDVTESGDGSSWATPLKTINEAVVFALNGDEIWVKQGEYLLDETITIDGGKSVKLYGGFEGGETHKDERDWQNNETVIHGNNTIQCLENHGELIIDGFTFTGGNSNYGGAIYSSSDSISTIINCTFSENTASYNGGAIYSGISATSTITNCAFTLNSTSDDHSTGGAIDIYNGSDSIIDISECIFYGNSSVSGGAIYVYDNDGSTTIDNCTFSGNSASSWGGAINGYVRSITDCTFSGNSSSGAGAIDSYGPDTTITGCIFTQNSTSSYSGGAIYINRDSAHSITNCIFVENSSSARGGAIYANSHSAHTITNCIFAENTSSASGGAIYNSDNTTCNITNTSFTNNDAPYSGGAITNYYNSITITNSVLWGDTPGELGGYDYTITVTYSDIQGGHIGEGNIDADPIFLADGTYGLTWGSPCIDAGTSSGAPDTGIYGQSRPYGSGYDMGAVEYDGDGDNDNIADEEDNCPGAANPEQTDSDDDDFGDACDGCPNDTNKIDPGICGCGVPDIDTDGDETLDCQDPFPDDPDEWLDTDGDGIGNNADTDDDDDGMPDSWEQQYGLDPLVNDADGDMDGDGYSNLQEYDAGSDPSDMYEKDDTCDTARVIVLNDSSSQHHSFNDKGDQDLVKFYGISGETYDIETANLEQNCDTVIMLYDEDGDPVLDEAWNDGGYEEGELLSWQCPSDGIYYVVVEQYDRMDYGQATGYDLNIRHPVVGESGWLRGLVVSSLGHGINDAVVKSGVSNSTALTNDDGTYLMVLPSGTHTMIVDSTGYEEKTQEGVAILADSETVQDFILSPCLDLNLGWNLISFSLYLQPDVASIDSVLNSIVDRLISVWAYMEGRWQVYDPANPGFSDLSTMEAGRGYWINMSEEATLTVSGSAPSNSIELINGWNLVGYNSDTSQSVGDALESIDGYYISVWAYMDGGWKIYDPENPGFSDLLTMEPGYGYWINAKEECIWTLP
jgi:predicted outer membrane repeat protein